MATDLDRRVPGFLRPNTGVAQQPTTEGTLLAVLENELDKNPKHGLNVNAVKGSISRLDRLGTKYQDMNDSDKTKAWVCAQKLLCRGQKEGRGDLCHKFMQALGVPCEPKMSAVGEALIRIAPVGPSILSNTPIATSMDAINRRGSLTLAEGLILKITITELKLLAEKNGAPLSAGQEKLIASLLERVADAKFEPRPLYGYDRMAAGPSSLESTEGFGIPVKWSLRDPRDRKFSIEHFEYPIEVSQSKEPLGIPDPKYPPMPEYGDWERYFRRGDAELDVRFSSEDPLIINPKKQ